MSLYRNIEGLIDMIGQTISHYKILEKLGEMPISPAIPTKNGGAKEGVYARHATIYSAILVGALFAYPISSPINLGRQLNVSATPPAEVWQSLPEEECWSILVPGSIACF